MIFTIPAPPPLTGDGESDAARLCGWCRLLHTTLKHTLGTFENSIAELSAAQNAAPPQEAVPEEGGNV